MPANTRASSSRGRKSATGQSRHSNNSISATSAATSTNRLGSESLEGEEWSRKSSGMKARIPPAVSLVKDRPNAGGLLEDKKKGGAGNDYVPVSYDRMALGKKIFIWFGVFFYFVALVIAVSKVAYEPFLDHQIEFVSGKSGSGSSSGIALEGKVPKVVSPVLEILAHMEKRRNHHNHDHSFIRVEDVWNKFLDQNAGLMEAWEGPVTGGEGEGSSSDGDASSNNQEQRQKRRKIAFALLHRERQDLEQETQGWVWALAYTRTWKAFHYMSRMDENYSLSALGAHVVSCFSYASEMSCPASFAFYSNDNPREWFKTTTTPQS